MEEKVLCAVLVLVVLVLGVVVTRTLGQAPPPRTPESYQLEIQVLQASRAHCEQQLVAMWEQARVLKQQVDAAQAAQKPQE